MTAGTLCPGAASVSTVHCSTRSPSNSLQGKDNITFDTFESSTQEMLFFV